MKFPETLTVRVAAVETVTPEIKRYTFVDPEGGELPGFSAGSHLVVHMPAAGRTYRNAYSLMSDPADRSRYQIAVRRQEASRGGSVYMHEQVRVGDLLQVSPPANLFALDRLAAKHVLIADQPLGTHVYVCGPEGLIQAVVEAARELGWPDSHVHYEQFAAPQPGAPFVVECARSGCTVEVPGDLTLLDALEGAGVAVPNLCRGGVCGQCETVVLAGEVEHRDSYLPEAERGRKIMPCVSRACGARLVLDL